MANFAKYTRRDSIKMLRHYERAKDKDGNYISYNNQNIDPTKTPGNYNLHVRDDDLSDYEFTKKRAEELKAFKRDDVKVLGSWVVTLPETFKLEPAELQRDFFEHVYNFASNRYGEDNVVSANVHVDETTPHMHFGFVPAYYDPDKKTYKVNAKKLMTRHELRDFQRDLSKYMEQIYGRDVGILTNTRDGINKGSVTVNKSIAELKQLNHELNKDYVKLQQKAVHLAKSNQSLRDKAQSTYEDNKKIQADNKVLRAENEAIKQALNNMGLIERLGLKTAKKHVQELKDQADQHAKDINRVLHDNAILKKQNDQLNTNIASMQKKEKNLINVLNIEKDRNKIYAERIKELKRQRNRLTGTVGDDKKEDMQR